jgi:formylglycine-generating enzyme
MQATYDSRPVHRVYVDGFWTDRTVVTNDQFAKLVAPTRYITIADMVCTIWQATSGRWTSDWYRANYYRTLTTSGEVPRNPQGPAVSLDPEEPQVPKKVHRGGSFLCTAQYCSRYMVGTRGKGAIDTGTNRLGFRCVRAPRRT